MEVKRCVNCMEDMKEVTGAVCPHCGFDHMEKSIRPMHRFIRPNTILHGRYFMGNVLGEGGFGITYIGYDLVLDIKVAIKEYFPQNAAHRDGITSSLIWYTGVIDEKEREKGYNNFRKEAQKIAKIDEMHSIVRVRDTFLDNNTAYIVMDYVAGVSLKDKVRKEGPMELSELLELLLPMMEDLAEVHKLGLIHRDISPDNIVIRPDGRVKLLDLGAAMDISTGSGEQTQLVAKKGFSPPEQYASAGKIGPWTDVYSLCATIFYCVTGKVIPSAIDRISGSNIEIPSELNKTTAEKVLNELSQGLELDIHKRIQSVDELLLKLQIKKSGIKSEKNSELQNEQPELKSEQQSELQSEQPEQQSEQSELKSEQKPEQESEKTTPESEKQPERPGGDIELQEEEPGLKNEGLKLNKIQIALDILMTAVLLVQTYYVSKAYMGFWPNGYYLSDMLKSSEPARVICANIVMVVLLVWHYILSIKWSRNQPKRKYILFHTFQIVLAAFIPVSICIYGRLAEWPRYIHWNAGSFRKILILYDSSKCVLLFFAICLGSHLNLMLETVKGMVKKPSVIISGIFRLVIRVLIACYVFVVIWVIILADDVEDYAIWLAEIAFMFIGYNFMEVARKIGSKKLRGGKG